MKRTIATLAALAGAVFCVLAALGATEAICVTAGCAVFSGTAILGIDLYWLGAVYFLALAALLVLERGRREVCASLLAVILAGLVIDAILLAFQAVTASCANCLVVATLLGTTAALLLPGPPILRRTLVVWAVLFAAAVSGLLRDGLTPVPAFGDNGAAVQVFFSPSCPACRGEVSAMAARSELRGDLALYPLARSESDLQAMLRFRHTLARSSNLAEAVEACFDRSAAGPKPSLSETLSLRLTSLRNKIFLARAGAESIPYVLTSTPGLLAPPASAPPEAERPGALSPPPGDDGCGYTTDEYCPDETEEPSTPSPDVQDPSEGIPDIFGPGPLQSPIR